MVIILIIITFIEIIIKFNLLLNKFGIDYNRVV
jgi:hypothetical protein